MFEGLFSVRISQVFPYGSVPLKTYLPDGDIDLTAINGLNAEKSLAHDVFALLQREEKNDNAEFQVKDTQFIDAEVIFVTNSVAALFMIKLIFWDCLNLHTSFLAFIYLSITVSSPLDYMVELLL